MEFHAFHGCLEKEKLEGNTFLVDFHGEADLSKASESDNLADTIDYSKVYAAVKAEMDKPSDLLENVCGRIVNALRKDFPEFRKIKITVSKKNPPVGGECAWARVSMEYSSKEK